MTRAFVAVRPPEAVLDAVDAFVCSVAGGVPAGARWTKREQHHVTLQFLGNRADVDAVAAALHATIAVHAGDVQFQGVGAFPTSRRARVLWLGVGKGASLVAQLAAAVGVLLTPLGHEPEARPYHAHLTLARWRTPVDLRAVVDGRDDAVGDAWWASEIVVYESVLRRTGAEYVAREVIALPG